MPRSGPRPAHGRRVVGWRCELAVAAVRRMEPGSMPWPPVSPHAWGNVGRAGAAARCRALGRFSAWTTGCGASCPRRSRPAHGPAGGRGRRCGHAIAAARRTGPGVFARRMIGLIAVPVDGVRTAGGRRAGRGRAPVPGVTLTTSDHARSDALQRHRHGVRRFPPEPSTRAAALHRAPVGASLPAADARGVSRTGEPRLTPCRGLRVARRDARAAASPRRRGPSWTSRPPRRCRSAAGRCRRAAPVRPRRPPRGCGGRGSAR